MFKSLTFWTTVVVALIVYVCLSIGLRWRAELRRRRRSPGTAFDASAIAPQLRRVRRDYIAALHSRSHRATHRTELIAAARRIVMSFSYFRRAGSEDESRKHDMRLVFVIALCVVGVLVGCVSDSERAEPPRVRIGMSRDDLRFYFGNPMRIEPAASGGEDWYYSFASWGPPQVESTSSVDAFGERTASVSVSMSDTKTKQECPIHFSSDGYVIEPIPAGKIVGK
jgi:hypothetical protein